LADFFLADQHDEILRDHASCERWSMLGGYSKGNHVATPQQQPQTQNTPGRILTRLKLPADMCPAIAVRHITWALIVSVSHDHTHVSNILLEAARHEENKCITAAAMVKRISTVKVLSKIKIILERP
jgi:hypothetical protein